MVSDFGWSNIQQDWKNRLQKMWETSSFQQLHTFLQTAYDEGRVYPREEDVFRAFQMTPYQDVKVVILGQDPYHGPHQAQGLSFSVSDQVRIPPSLRNIFRELHDDLGCTIPKAGDLTEWAKQGVLLLNTVLTVEEGRANSHRHKGWELFTDGVMKELNAREKPIVFLLWGKPAEAKRTLLDESRHVCLCAPHPSPLSARRGFFGSRPFSKANAQLRKWGYGEVNWSLEEQGL